MGGPFGGSARYGPAAADDDDDVVVVVVPGRSEGRTLSRSLSGVAGRGVQRPRLSGRCEGRDGSLREG